MLGICKKAGKITVGADLVADAIRQNKAFPLVLLSGTASENTVKRVKNCCTFYGIPLMVLPFDGDTLGKAVGKKSTVSAVAITDKGLSDAVIALLDKVSEQTEHREDNE